MRFTTFIVFVAIGLHGEAQPQPVNVYSLEKEAVLGRGLAQEFERHSKPLEIAPVTEYLQAMVDRLAGGFPEKPFPYKVRLLGGDPGRLTHEPFSLPGGYLYVSSSLILEAHSDAELAGMLAHSMAHIVARHGTRQATRRQVTGVADTPLIFMGGWQGCNADNQKVLIPSGFLWAMRRFEEEADQMAVRAMAAAGYDPRALAAYLRRVQPETTSGAYPAMPAKAERIAAIESAISRLSAGPFAAPERLHAVQEALRCREAAGPEPKAPTLQRVPRASR